jgi:hypothetical protein
MFPARCRYHLLLTAAVVLSSTGCLNLGGKTTHVHDNPETNTRLAAVENRVSILEQVLARPATSIVPSQE